MKARLYLSIIGILAVVILKSQNLTIYRSELDVDATANKLVSLIKEKELIYFETVAHDQIASERGLKIEPTRSILFEDPDLTTKLISCQQTTALDLPLEFLVWEEQGDVYIGFVDPKFMKKRFLVMGCDDTIQSLTKLMVRLANDVIRE